MRSFTIVIFQDQTEPDVWYGAVPAVRGVHSNGTTRDQALQMTTLALEGTLELFFELGLVIPPDLTNLEPALAQIRDDFGLSDANFEMVQVDLSAVVRALSVFESEVSSFATASS